MKCLRGARLPRRQKPGQSLDEYLQVLCRMKFALSLRPNTAMASFGTHSLTACCHVPYASGYYKKITLTIDATFQKALSFGIAQKNTELIRLSMPLQICSNSITGRDKAYRWPNNICVLLWMKETHIRKGCPARSATCCRWK